MLIECQVKHWPKHKKACDMIAEVNAGAVKDNKFK